MDGLAIETVASDETIAMWEDFVQFMSPGNGGQLIWAFGKAFIAIFIGIAISRMLRAMINRFFKKQEATRKSATLRSVLNSVVKYGIWFITLCQILLIFNIPIESFLAVAGIGGVAIGFGAQTLIKDIISGLFIVAEDQFSVGDFIAIGEFSGTVEAIGLRTIRLRGFNGDTYIIPNGEISIVTNKTKGYNQAIVDIPVAYAASLEKVFAILKDELEQSGQNMESITAPPQVLGVTELEREGLKVRVVARCKAGEQWSVERELRKRIWTRFCREGLEIPYPHTVVRVEKQEEA